MHVQYVAICDHVVMGADGKPSLIGIFDHIQAERVPVTMPRFAFVARILFTPEEAGRNYKLEVVITDPEGKELGRPGGDLGLPPSPGVVDSFASDVPILFDMFQFNAFGRYSFVLTIDGKQSAGVQVSVRQAVLS